MINKTFGESSLKSFFLESEHSVRSENFFVDIAQSFLKWVAIVLFFRGVFEFAVTQDTGLNLYINITASLLVLLSWFFVKKTKKYEKILALVISCEYIVILYQASHTGGINAPTVSWLLAIPVVCFLLIPKFAFITIVLSLLAPLVLSLSPDLFGLSSGSHGYVQNDWVYFSHVVSAILSVAYLAYLYELKTWGLVERINQARENLNIYKKAIDASSEGIVITNPRITDNPIIYVNKAYEQITGYSFDESVGRNCRFLQTNKNSPELNRLREAIKEERSVSVTLENRRKNQELFFNRLTISPIFEAEDLAYFIGVQRDVTNERNISLIFEQSQRIAKMEGFVYRPDRDQIVWTSSTEQGELFRVHRPKRAKEAFSFVSDDQAVLLDETLQKSWKNKTSFELEVEGLNKKGERAHFLIRGEPDLDEREIVRVFGLVQDVSESVKLRQKLKTMILTLTDIIFVLDAQGTYVEVMCQNEDDLIQAKEKLTGTKISDHLEPSFAEMCITMVRDSIENKKINALDYDLMIEGEKRYFSAKIASSDGETAVCTIKNITHERQVMRALENERRERTHQTKMSALGEMAGGIAHEINNPLTIIGGYAYKLKRQMKKSDDESVRVGSEYAEKIIATVERISKIINSMRRYARDGSNDPMELVELDEILNDTLELCQQRFRSLDVTFTIDSSLEIGTKVYCRQVEIAQVLLNLLNNSIDALKEIEMQGDSNDLWIKIKIQKTDDQTIELRIIDCGKGIPKEYIDQLFEPFFTSKGAGIGTGLGLSIAQNIMKQHGGDLTYESDQANTTFLMKLKTKSS